MIFHSSLISHAIRMQPSKEVFNNMLHELEMERANPDGADQGFLGSYFSDLLDRPMFHPAHNRSKLNGNYRLPLGYQMDASYYCKTVYFYIWVFHRPFLSLRLLLCFSLRSSTLIFYTDLKLRWSIPCGPNSVITFPSAPWLKPWYWWSWPVLPLGLSWHEQRRITLGWVELDCKCLIVIGFGFAIILENWTRDQVGCSFEWIQKFNQFEIFDRKVVAPSAMDVWRLLTLSCGIMFFCVFHLKVIPSAISIIE